jgi:hypothetical protein
MKILLKKDELYWSGKPTGMSDAEFDRLSQLSGLISQPRARGWARFPKAKLARPNFGMGKIYRLADLKKYDGPFFYRPKWDGIYVQVSYGQVVTRGDGRTGLDISDWSIKSRVSLPWRLLRDGDVVFGELVLPKPYGRNDLVRAIAADKAPPCRPVVIPHNLICIKGLPPDDIPPAYHVPDYYVDGFDADIDGWVCQVGTGDLVAFKKK